jgi:diaminopimelate epimerase
MHFKKYQGTGNDFIMLDNLSGEYDKLSISDVQLLCDRRFGIGADGLIKINQASAVDFQMDYYNSDGSKSFCGNGARCAVVFAKQLNVFQGNHTTFNAIDGVHSAELIHTSHVRLKMGDVEDFERDGSVYEIHTGSPHYIDFNKQELGIVDFGKSIRYSKNYNEKGINVNLVQEEAANRIYVETYERGVEDETLSCGTGVTACALAYLDKTNQESGSIEIRTKGGVLQVDAVRSGNGFSSVYLSGPAEFVFEGTFVLE